MFVLDFCPGEVGACDFGTQTNKQKDVSDKKETWSNTFFFKVHHSYSIHRRDCNEKNTGLWFFRC